MVCMQAYSRTVDYLCTYADMRMESHRYDTTCRIMYAPANMTCDGSYPDLALHFYSIYFSVASTDEWSLHLPFTDHAELLKGVFFHIFWRWSTNSHLSKCFSVWKRFEMVITSRNTCTKVDICMVPAFWGLCAKLMTNHSPVTNFYLAWTHIVHFHQISSESHPVSQSQ